MDELLNSITKLVAETHPTKIQQIAMLIRDEGNLNVDKVIKRVPLGMNGTAILKAILAICYTSKVSLEELSGMLLGSSYAYHQAKEEVATELVWTGPSTEMVATRRTEQALLEVINAAKQTLFLMSFVAYKVGSVTEALKKAVGRGVSVSIVLESSDQHGGDISIDSIGKMHESVAGAKIYFWREKDGDFIGGKVHAKVAVADESECFISSANLTGYAMEKNMEAGVLIRGGDIPERLHQHLNALVTTSVITLYTKY
ncbi:MAG: DISARM system phospholipase D-like protein DrmC [Candidatus Thiodiazotropha lotti]|nr:DISARM system phospholipase D-like protein DrmC [Candidatus Thiodiazotropha lotti]MCW4222419.1 DISARM system phospholipase D-like protein DrmC [Candidatus Thiodiazotropha lotti]